MARANAAADSPMVPHSQARPSAREARGARLVLAATSAAATAARRASRGDDDEYEEREEPGGEQEQRDHGPEPGPLPVHGNVEHETRR